MHVHVIQTNARATVRTFIMLTDMSYDMTSDITTWCNFFAQKRGRQNRMSDDSFCGMKMTCTKIHPTIVRQFIFICHVVRIFEFVMASLGRGQHPQNIFEKTTAAIFVLHSLWQFAHACAPVFDGSHFQNVNFFSQQDNAWSLKFTFVPVSWSAKMLTDANFAKVQQDVFDNIFLPTGFGCMKIFFIRTCPFCLIFRLIWRAISYDGSKKHQFVRHVASPKLSC